MGGSTRGSARATSSCRWRTSATSRSSRSSTTPPSYKAPFGQAVRARSEAGGGWLGWASQVDDISEAEQRLGREAVVGSRHRPDGVSCAGGSWASRA